MTCPTPQFEELADLVWALVNDRLDAGGEDRLRARLESDAGSRRIYIELMDQFALLEWDRSEGRTAGDPECGVVGNGGFGVGDSGFGVRDSGFGIRDSGLGVRDFHVPNPKSQIPNQQIPSLSTLHSPLSTNFVGGPVFSYIAATLILGVMLLGAWAYKITRDYGPSYAINSRGSTTPGEPAQRPELVFVARVTGMKDCRWADPATETYAGAYVPLGRKYALASGLMEITYLSGAKVILEGPCRYEVESTASGFLALGKLTARVEERSEVRGQRSEVRGQRSEDRGLAASAASVQPQAAKPQAPSPKPQDLRPKTEISKSPNLQISKFSVRTPTAVVTDLGTEFGVEVSANGDTTSHVFQGTINVRVAGGLAASAASDAGQITLTAGQSARVEKDAETGAARIATGERAGPPPRFIRRIVSPVRELDLLDIVAGGDGRGARRERGIDPSTGLDATKFISRYLEGDGNYHPVAWNKLVDGVFIPDGRAGKVQLDSAGHAFDNFPPTEGKAWCDIWARSAETKVSQIHSSNPDGCWMYSAGRGDQQSFMPGRRGLLGLHANAGITFDLGAIRRAHPGASIKSFRAVAGMLDAAIETPWANARADAWIFIDGRPAWKRIGLRPMDGQIDVDLALRPENRFLTLVSTDGGDGLGRDWVVFGDPVLKLSSITQDQLKGGTDESQRTSGQ